MLLFFAFCPDMQGKLPTAVYRQVFVFSVDYSFKTKLSISTLMMHLGTKSTFTKGLRHLKLLKSRHLSNPEQE